jgi:formylglycine-generating enzyme required for sulfatase activity
VSVRALQSKAPREAIDRDMAWIEAATFRMGSDDHYPEERPARPVSVEGFWIDRRPVTNADFGRFVEATGWITSAEIAPRAEDYPGALPEMLVPASLVFTPTSGPVDLRQPGHWWRYVLGADWRHPLGPSSSLKGLEDHPVVHVAWSDVQAYAEWAGADLPNEAEWELASRGGLDGAEFAWGEELTPGGRHMANVWQGRFPWENLASDGWARTSPVGFYPPNGFGLHDMIGNVWEWTQDWWSTPMTGPTKSCCGPPRQGGREDDSYDPAQPELRIPRKVLKGGSHLCAPCYCRRYRPAARHPHPVDTSTSHVGFRCVRRPEST